MIGHTRSPANVVPSDTEDRFAELVHDAGLPPPVHRYGVALPDGWVEVDFAWPGLLVAVECDSSFHAGRSAMEADRERDQALMAAGWRVFRVTWRQLHDDPARVLRRLRRVLADAARHRSAREP